MTCKELERSISDLRRQLQEYEDIDEGNGQLFRGTRQVLRHILKSRYLKHNVKHSSGSSNPNSCPEHFDELIVKGTLVMKINLGFDLYFSMTCVFSIFLKFSVPFQSVLKFVADREVQLSGGMALLRCDQIPIVLCHVFVSLLEYSSQKMRETNCLKEIGEDSRFKDLIESLKKIYTGMVPFQRSISKSNGSLTLERLDEYSQYFPPCMRAIHHTLRTRHRLCHHPRVQYTLYLKDIGLPIEDFLKLLQMEYSRPAVQTDPNQKHKCSHSWGADSKRYIYGTRSLYGLQGARINYSSHSCRKIQVRSKKKKWFAFEYSNVITTCLFSCREQLLVRVNVEAAHFPILTKTTY